MSSSGKYKKAAKNSVRRKTAAEKRAENYTRQQEEKNISETDKMPKSTRIALIAIIAALLILLLITGTRYYKLSKVHNASSENTTTTEQED